MWFIRGFVEFSGSSFEDFSSKLKLTDSKIVRNIGKMLLEYRVEFPQMDTPNGWPLKAFKGLRFFNLFYLVFEFLFFFDPRSKN